MPHKQLARRRNRLPEDRAASASGLARRVDWRLLLPSSGPVDRLRLLGGDAELAALLVRLGVARRVLEGPADSTPVDAVVCLTGRPADLLAAVGQLRAGGVLYAEIDRRGRARGWSPARLCRALGRGGASATAYATRSHHGLPTLFVPLDVPAAAAWYLSELVDARGSARRRAQRLGAALGGTRLAHRLAAAVPRYCVVGMAAGTSHDLAPALLGDGASAARPIMLTRGEGPWSRVVLLPFGPHDTTPAEVHKVPRSPEHAAATRREQRTLTSIRATLPTGLLATVPEPRGVRDRLGLPVAVESFVPGRPLAFGGRSGRPGDPLLLDRATDWLVAFHRSTRGAPAKDLDQQLRGLAALLRGTPLDAEALCRRFGSAPFRGGPCPTVWEHGDLTPLNVRDTGAGITVVDWESARRGPPLTDLLYLLLHWDWPGVPPFGTAPETVLHRLFLTTEGTAGRAAARAVARYLAGLGLEAAPVGPLLMAMLARQALDRAQRVTDGGGDPAVEANVYRDLALTVALSPGPVPTWSAS